MYKSQYPQDNDDFVIAEEEYKENEYNENQFHRIDEQIREVQT